MADLYNKTNNNLNVSGLLTNLPPYGLGLGSLVALSTGLDWTTIGGHALDSISGGDHFYTLFKYLATNLATMYHQSDAIPFDQRAELFLMLTADAAMPVLTPTSDYVARIMKEMDFDEDAETLYRLPWVSTGVDVNGDGEIKKIDKDAETIFGDNLGGEWVFVYAYLDFTLEGGTLTVEVEYQKDQADPKDILEGDADPDELEDFEFVISFSDYGLCGCAWTSGDTILWQAGGVDQIPGYEITILLGVSGISVLALVYVIMKKRKR